MGVIRVTDNWEEECCQSIGGRWEEECASPNFCYEDHLRRLPEKRGRGAIPCLMIKHIGCLIEILQCNMFMIPMRGGHG